MAEIVSNLEKERQIGIELWDGCLPIEFSLAPCDLSASSSPSPVFVAACRYSFLSVVTEDIVSYFRSFAIDISSKIWFEYGGTPLRSNLPIGFLFDVVTSVSSDNSVPLPWKIAIHFQQFPSKKLITCNSMSEAEMYYRHSLKQAVFVLHGNLREYSSQSKNVLETVWKSICDGQRQEFEASINSLVLQRSQIRRIPVRVIVTSRGSSERLMQFAMPLIATPTDTIASPVTDVPPINDDIPDDGGDRKAGNGVAVTIASLLSRCAEYEDLSYGSAQAWCHGIPLPVSASVYDVWCLFAYADLFLYIVVHL